MTIEITTGHAASSYGQPVLVISGTAYGQADDWGSALRSALAIEAQNWPERCDLRHDGSPAPGAGIMDAMCDLQLLHDYVPGGEKWWADYFFSAAACASCEHDYA